MNGLLRNRIHPTCCLVASIVVVVVVVVGGRRLGDASINTRLRPERPNYFDPNFVAVRQRATSFLTRGFNAAHDAYMVNDVIDLSI